MISLYYIVGGNVCIIIYIYIYIYIYIFVLSSYQFMYSYYNLSHTFGWSLRSGKMDTHKTSCLLFLVHKYMYMYFVSIYLYMFVLPYMYS